MFLLTLYTSNYISALALVLSLTVRIHAGIVHGKPWTRFWYLCRAIDLSGTGIKERKFTKVPEIDAILEQGGQSSQKPAKGQVPFLLWVGEKRAFVSKGFIPIGSSQESIAAELGISDRTVRRHISHLGVKRRQLVQAKAAYRTIGDGLDWWAEEVHAEPDRIWYKEAQDGSIWFYDSNGVSSSRKPAQKITRDRFFSYRGKTWIYRCNLYSLDYATTSMRAARKQLAKLIAQNSARRGCERISLSNSSASE